MRAWALPVGAHLVGALLAAALLGGCSRVVAVEPAPDAEAPLCARVYTALPDVVAGLERRPTTAQGAAAWVGSGGAASGGGAGDAPVTVVLRCGVEPPAPTTQPCADVDGGGARVQWVVAAALDGRVTWTTYGRTPAVALEMPDDDVVAAAAPIDVGPAVAQVPQARTCD